MSPDSHLSRPARGSRAARVALGRTLLGRKLLGRKQRPGRLSARALAMFCAILAVFVGLAVAQAAPVSPLLVGGLAGSCTGAGQAHVSRSGLSTAGHRSRALPAEAECESTDEAEGEENAAQPCTVSVATGPSAALRACQVLAAGSPKGADAIASLSSFWIGARPARGPPLVG